MISIVSCESCFARQENGIVLLYNVASTPPALAW